MKVSMEAIKDELLPGVETFCSREGLSYSMSATNDVITTTVGSQSFELSRSEVEDGLCRSFTTKLYAIVHNEKTNVKSQ